MMRLLLKVLFLPVFILIGILRAALKVGTKVCSWAIGWFWLLLVVATVMIVSDHAYGQLAIVGVSAVASFVVLFVIIWAEMTLGDLKGYLKSKI